MAKMNVTNLNATELAAVRNVIENLHYELIPLSNVIEQAAFLPERATVSVTASPAKGMQATIDLSLQLQDMGMHVIPHFSARLTTDRAELEANLKAIDKAGIHRVFIVGGDADPPGEFFDAFSLLQAIDDIGHTIDSFGITGYPEGHPIISDELLEQAIVDKAPFAQYITTQMCFEPDTITDWIGHQRDRGIELPVYLGIPGSAELKKLLGISARIGVGDSIKFAAKNPKLIGRLVKPGGYSPDALILGLAPALTDDRINIEGFHCYTFNQVERTEEWRRDMLEALS
ncbi:MAG: methylenetetrahydrofolate reductase [Acidimicrobiia bacterium]|nr:methylenetetrahydrofolate reductase [Acidimicrobiia bacterium]